MIKYTGKVKIKQNVYMDSSFGVHIACIWFFQMHFCILQDFGKSGGSLRDFNKLNISKANFQKGL